MGVITIANLSDKIVPVPDQSRSLLYAIQACGMDWMHACGGKGRCTTCKVSVLDGGEFVQPLTDAEQHYRKAGLLMANERLACQAKTSGDIVISVPAESKLPHIKYSF